MYMKTIFQKRMSETQKFWKMKNRKEKTMNSRLPYNEQKIRAFSLTVEHSCAFPASAPLSSRPIYSFYAADSNYVHTMDQHMVSYRCYHHHQRLSHCNRKMLKKPAITHWNHLIDSHYCDFSSRNSSNRSWLLVPFLGIRVISVPALPSSALRLMALLEGRAQHLIPRQWSSNDGL